MRSTLAICALVVAVAAGCGGGSGSGGSSSPTTTASSCRTGTYRVALTSSGQRRTALVHVPRLSGADAPPLYLVLHFAGGTGAQMQRVSGMSELGDRRGFVAAYPDALPRSRPLL